MNDVKTIVQKALDGVELDGDEVAALFDAPLFSMDSACILATARKLSERASNGSAEVHAQIGLNIAPCPCNCKFCAFAACNGVFTESSELPVEEAVSAAKIFEQDGANGIFLMGTADYPFSRFVEVAQEVRRALLPETVMVANVGDFDKAEAKKLKDAGFAGIYHAIRLGEGRDTKLDPKRRLETFQNAREAGLHLGTCLEPVGTEHSTAELVEKTLITRDAGPVYSGSARRIPIPGTEMARLGIVSEARMAHILAVVRLAVGLSVPGNCTHEPNVIGAAAGANFFWAEVGSNPRDSVKDTKDARGKTVTWCRNVLEEAEWKVLNGPSMIYG